MNDGILCGMQVIEALMVAASSGGHEELRETTAALSDDQARWALCCLAYWDADVTAGAGIHIAIDDELLALLRDADGFTAACTIVAAQPSASVRAALANLAAHHVDLRRSSLAGAWN